MRKGWKQTTWGKKNNTDPNEPEEAQKMFIKARGA